MNLRFSRSLTCCGLALPWLRFMTDEAEDLVLAGAVLGYLVGVGSDDGVDQ